MTDVNTNNVVNDTPTKTIFKEEMKSEDTPQFSIHSDILILSPSEFSIESNPLPTNVRHFLQSPSDQSIDSTSSTESMVMSPKSTVNLHIPLLQSPSERTIQFLPHENSQTVSLPHDRTFVDVQYVQTNTTVSAATFLKVSASNPMESLFSLAPTRLKALATHGTTARAEAQTLVQSSEEEHQRLSLQRETLEAERAAAAVELQVAQDNYANILSEVTSIDKEMECNDEKALVASSHHAISIRIQDSVAHLLQIPLEDRPFGRNSTVTIAFIQAKLDLHSRKAIMAKDLAVLMRANCVLANLGYSTHLYFQCLQQSQYWRVKYGNGASFVTKSDVSQIVLADRISDSMGFLDPLTLPKPVPATSMDAVCSPAGSNTLTVPPTPSKTIDTKSGPVVSGTKRGRDAN